MLAAILLGVGYLCGAIPTGLLVARRLGAPDPRTAGSGNIGATNLARLAGWRAGAVTLAGDALKGAAPVALALALGVGAAAAALLAAAAVVGHCHPVTLGFAGGKGVATAAGGFAVVAPAAVACALGAWLLAMAATRTSAVASLTASAALVAALFLLGAPPSASLAGTATAALIFARHRDNLRRLARRREPKVRT